MSFRFRKRVSVFGGLGHVNLSKTGVSLSVGPRGANVNLGGFGPTRHPRMTVGLPGTGLSYTQRLDGTQNRPMKVVLFVAILSVVLAVFFGIIH
jgi:hypothetical protein